MDYHGESTHLKLVAHSLDIQTVGSDDVWLPLDEVLRLLGRDVTDGREDVSEVGGRPLQAVSVVDLPLARLYVHVEVLEVVVEVHGSSTQVSAQESGVSREYGGHLHLPQAEHDEGDARHPLVEVCQDLRLLLLALRHLPLEIGNELRRHEAEDDQVVTLSVQVGNSNLSLLIQLLLPGVHVAAGRGDVEEDDCGVSFHQPLADLQPPSLVTTHLHRPGEGRAWQGYRGAEVHLVHVVRCEGAQHDVLVPQLLGGHGRLAPQHGVDPTSLVGHLPARFETPASLVYRYDKYPRLSQL